MVTTQEPQENDESIEVIEPEQTDDGGQEPAPEQEAPVTDTVAPTEEVPPAPQAEATGGQQASPEAQPQATPKQPEVSQQEINELYRRRTEEQSRLWSEKVGKTARALEQRLQENGYMPEQARDQARSYIRNEQKFKKHEQETAEMLGYVQGKHAATVDMMKKYGLATSQMMEDYKSLQFTETPAQMEQEAKRMKRERDLIAENTRLKQGRVSPQTFDNSQGAAESTSNQDRLLDAYINGAMSEAAVRAARRISMGN